MREIEQSPDPGSMGTNPGRLRKTVAMVGMMGAGKTAVGRALAARLGVPFLDSDAEIEAAANMSIPEIFARDGEAFFRARETEVIDRLMRAEAPVILSTGGGAFLSGRNREIIARNGVALWLQAELDVLWERVRHRNTRPLLQTADPQATLARLYDERVPFYAKAELAVRSGRRIPIETMVDRVIERLATRPDVLETGGAEPGEEQ